MVLGSGLGVGGALSEARTRTEYSVPLTYVRTCHGR